jgi:hypothetical protein
VSSTEFLLSAVLVVLTHELGHALSQRLCGVPVKKVVLGNGPCLIRTGVLEIRLLPLSGYVLPVGVLHARRRWQGVMIALSGVLATWLVVGVMILLHATSYGWLRNFCLGWVIWSVVGFGQLLPVRQRDGWWALVALGVLPAPHMDREGDS